jgi:type VI secretion system secreted protein Hcp
MIQRKIVPWAVSMAWISLTIAAQAAAFIKFDGIDGEAVDRDHQGWSDFGSFRHSIRQGGQDPAGGATRTGADMGNIILVKKMDKSTPKLAEAVVRGSVVPSVEIHLTKETADGARIVYFAYELKNVQVVSYQISSSGQADQIPTEELSLNFEEIKVTYTELDAKGSAKGKVEYSWKIEEGAK